MPSGKIGEVLFDYSFTDHPSSSVPFETSTKSNAFFTAAFIDNLAGNPNCLSTIWLGTRTVCTCINIYIYTHMCVYTYPMYSYIYIHIHVCVYIYIMIIHTMIHLHVYIMIYTWWFPRMGYPQVISFSGIFH